MKNNYEDKTNSELLLIINNLIENEDKIKNDIVKKLVELEEIEKKRNEILQEYVTIIEQLKIRGVINDNVV